MKRFERDLNLIKEKCQSKKQALDNKHLEYKKIVNENKEYKILLNQINKNIVDMKKQIEINKIYKRKKEKAIIENKRVLTLIILLEAISILAGTIIQPNLVFYLISLFLGGCFSGTVLSITNKKMRALDKRKELLIDGKDYSYKDLKKMIDFQKQREYSLKHKINVNDRVLAEMEKEIRTLMKEVSNLIDLYNLVYDHYQVAILLSQTSDNEKTRNQIINKEYTKVLTKVVNNEIKK